MLRITTTETEHERKWVLAGQLAGASVFKLTSQWISARTLGRSEFDLTDVTFIDRAGAKVLCAMEDAGVRFIARGVASKHLFEEIERKCAPHLQRCLSWWKSE